MCIPNATAINILTGLFLPSSGDAFVFGKSVLTEMTAIRRSMGVCPQHDVLWNELTAREHLEIFSKLKKIPKNRRKKIIEAKLESVRLREVGNNRVSSYSGGMKRRLSVAISSIGEPEIIFMDEPTTGMDPTSKRHVWKLIQQLKKNRVIFLTTHSMEEADVLADKIAIMAHGKLICVGNSLHLKNNFGDGYRMAVSCEIENVEAVCELVSRSVPDSKLNDNSGGNLVFSLPLASINEGLIGLLEQLEEEEKKPFGLIKSFGVSQTTLEDVFLKVTRKVYQGGKKLHASEEDFD